jgi:hypothetical protein
LASLLLNLFAWGEISAQRLQEVAQAAVQDIDGFAEGLVDVGNLKQMAKIGAAGHHQNKCYVDLMRHSEGTAKLPNPFICKLPFREPVHEALQSMLLPHELFAAIYHNYPRAWQQSLVPSEARLMAFWEAQKDHPQFLGHPVRKRANYQSRCVPISLHGDDVPVTGVGKTWTGKITQWCWASMIGRGPTTAMLFWIFALFERLRVRAADGTETTLHAFFKVLRWSFGILFHGVWPDRDHHGRMTLCRV